MNNLQLSQIKRMSSSTMIQSLTTYGKVFFLISAAAVISGLFRLAYNYLGR